MSIDNSKKSPRLLQSRRYTHETFTDAQEAFTSVLDINANEVYVDQDLIPASSVPFGTSGDNLSIYNSGGQDVIKYYYRYKMTKSSTNNQVWFFTTGTTAGIDAQLIDSNQQKNFISPKYSIPSLSTANAEDSPVGYGVKVFVSTNSSSPSAGDQLDPTKFVFDYKTGVLQFVLTADAPDNTKYVYITAYQYVGRTLKDALVTSVASSSGTSGTSGSNGTDGSSGTSGSSGSSGSNGTDGSSGTSGSNGTDGSSGSSGTSGSNGTDGSSGTSGSNGTDGSSGTSGSSGISGVDGTNGSSGSNGTDGSSGSSGTSGSNGTDGSSGTSGSNGTDGSSGSSGTSGSNGTDGSSGTSGSNGTDGSSGSSGDSLFAETGSFWATTNDIQITGSLSISSQLGINDANVLLNESASLVLTSGSNIYIENGGFITASFKGDGAGLYNIPATGVTGLQLDRIISGSVSASMADGTLRVNTDVNIDGTLTARELHIDYVTSSVLYTSGSTKFGDTADDLHQFTGSVFVSGSINILSGSLSINGVSFSAMTSGTSGSNGTDGSSGSNGTDGSSGTSGSNGTDGSSGTSGSNGTDGSSGSNGTDGSSGSNGTDGSSGSNGTDGSSGTSGSNGTDGSSGTSGSSGSNGTDGSSGSSGSNGTDGSSGSSGISGVDGTNGSSGSNGTNGSSGTSGSNGTDGSSGTSGDSLFANSGSYWTTTNNVEITGSVKIKGVLTAEEYNVTLVSSSVLYSSGSTKFGDTADDLHQFTGSLRTSGSVVINGDLTVNGTTVLTSTDLLRESLIVSGAMAIMQAQIQAQMISASLSMQGQRVITYDMNTGSVMDLGGF